MLYRAFASRVFLFVLMAASAFAGGWPGSGPGSASADERRGRGTVGGARGQSGVASYYARKYHGRPTASGEPFDMHKLTAAHRTLPFGTRVRVVTPATGRSVTVRINDRGPFVAGRVIDLSYAAAAKLNILEAGLAAVTLDVLDGPPVTVAGTN